MSFEKTMTHPQEHLLRTDRFPHIWCPTCGIGTVVKCFATALEEAEGSEGLVAEGFDAREDLVAAVEAGDDVVAGLWFPEGFAAEAGNGRRRWSSASRARALST